MSEKEIWKPVPIEGLDKRYEISNFGNLKRLRFKDTNGRIWPSKLMFPKLSGKSKYYQVNVTYKRNLFHLIIHRLVGLAFLPNPNNLPCINHIDGDKLNNKVSNLEWISYSDNNKHAFKTGLKSHKKGNDHPKFAGVINVYKDGFLIDKLYGKTDIKQKGYRNGNVYHCLNGNRKTHKGCTFERENLQGQEANLVKAHD